MELYIGGFAQGKLEYVTNKYNCAKVYDGKNYKYVIILTKIRNNWFLKNVRLFKF